MQAQRIFPPSMVCRQEPQRTTGVVVKLLSKRWAEAVILPKERDPRFVTIRRGGTLEDSHHRLLAQWAAEWLSMYCLSSRRSSPWIRGPAVRWSRLGR